MFRSSLRPHWRSPFFRVCIVVILLGIGLRFYHLDHKLFWHDEVYTAIPVSGFERGELRDDWIEAQGLMPADLQRYQTVTPDVTWADTLKALEDEEPQNSPLYFLLANSWVKLTQSPTILGMRSLSAGIGLLLFPGAFWLCWEVFQSWAIATFGTALIGISPIHLIYAQEARQYSLMTVLTVFASAVFVRSLRQSPQRLKSLSLWALYALLCLLGLYTQPFFLFVMLAHGLSFILAARHTRQTWLGYGLATLISILGYVPWLWFILTDLDAISGWRSDTNLTLLHLMGRWLLNLSRTLADFYVGDAQLYDLQWSLQNPLLYWVLVATLLTGYTCADLMCKSDRKSWLFIMALIGAPVFLLLLADLLFGGVRSTIPRYFLASYLGLQLAIIHLFSSRIFDPKCSARKRSIWQMGAIVLLILSSLSCFQMSQSTVWWSKYSNYYGRRFRSPQYLRKTCRSWLCNHPPAWPELFPQCRHPPPIG